MNSDLNVIIQYVMELFLNQMKVAVSSLELDNETLDKLLSWAVEEYAIDILYINALKENFSDEEINEIRNYLEKYQPRMFEAGAKINAALQNSLFASESKFKAKIAELMEVQ
jgi:hypothetical protein